MTRVLLLRNTCLAKIYFGQISIGHTMSATTISTFLGVLCGPAQIGQESCNMTILLAFIASSYQRNVYPRPESQVTDLYSIWNIFRYTVIAQDYCRK